MPNTRRAYPSADADPEQPTWPPTGSYDHTSHEQMGISTDMSESHRVTWPPGGEFHDDADVQYPDAAGESVVASSEASAKDQQKGVYLPQWKVGYHERHERVCAAQQAVVRIINKGLHTINNPWQMRWWLLSLSLSLLAAMSNELGTCAQWGSDARQHAHR